MITLDDQEIFSTGPCSLQPGPLQRNIERRTVSGLSGEIILDLGPASRTLILKGWLQAATKADLLQTINAIETFVDGQTHILIDSNNRTWPDVVLEQFEQTSPIQLGRGYWCEYSCQFLQNS
jgi:hypothetical protein